MSTTELIMLIVWAGCQRTENAHIVQLVGGMTGSAHPGGNTSKELFENFLQ
jgi:hypothetical protein